MYFDDYRIPRGPSIDDDPTLSGPAGAHVNSSQSGQTEQPGSTPRMNLNGQAHPEGHTRPSEAYRRQTDPSRPFSRSRSYGETSRRPAPHRKRTSWGKRIASLVLCGLLFGSVAGLTFHGTTSMLAAGSSGSGAVATQLSASNTGALDVSAIAEGTLPSVVSITNTSVTEINDWFSFFYGGGSGRTQETTSVGSGVVIQKTDNALYIVTNYHVIKSATTLSVTFSDGESYEAQLVGGDERNDIAVIRVPLSVMSSSTLSAIQVAAIGNSDQLAVGQQVVAIGNALGYGQSVTTGVVSALDRTLENEDGSTASYIQTDAAINPGNSGGALVNMNGEVVGINTAKLSSTEIEGMGYAIPMTRVAQIVSGILTQGSAL